ncbi:MAG: sigma-70 family RNA polymerase sigma factor [Bacteroidota bacterium]
MKPDEQVWLAEIRGGDSSAYRHLVERYQQMAYALALSLVKHEEEAEEVVQDAFVQAFRGLGQFRGEAKFSTWLYRIVWRTAQRKMRTPLPFVELPEQEATADPQPTGDHQLQQQDRTAFLQSVLQQLPEKERTVLDLFYFHECSVKEIAEICELRTSNVKVLLHRGRKRLATLIPAHWQQALMES